MADYESGDSRNSIREACADLHRNRCFHSSLGMNQEGKEIEIKTLCNRQKTGKISTNSLSRELAQIV